MASFTTETLLPARPEQVFAGIVDLSQWPLFKGYGPLPGIVEASLPDGGTVGLGARIRVKNTDGSVHHEVVEVFEPSQRYAIRMELNPPVSWIMASILEEIHVSAAEPPSGGTRMVRHFVVTPRGWWSAPMVWLIAGWFLPTAVERHNAAVVAALRAVSGGSSPG